ncbi:MAG: hypothetical protein ACREF3_14155 [Acetobacteraceae bacterium]
MTGSLVAAMLLPFAIDPVRAQPANFDAISDATDAMADALLATPNRKTPVPDVNLFATAPGEEQATTRLGTLRLNALAPLYYTSNAEGLGSGGSNSAEANPEVNLAGSLNAFDSRFRLSGLVRAETDRYAPASGSNFDKLRINVTARYLNPNNDQAFSPFISYIPRLDFEPTFSREFATRQDLNFGVSKLFNFDSSFKRLPPSGRSSAEAAWSFGISVFGQRRFRSPAPQSYAVILAPSVAYWISDRWNASFDLFLTRRWYEPAAAAGTPNSFLMEPIAVLEYVMPDSWFGGNARAFGSPALDLQASYERYWTKAPGFTASTWWVGFAIKTGWGLF